MTPAPVPVRCRLCRRILRNPASAARGVGPVCLARNSRTIRTGTGRTVRVLELELDLTPVYETPLFR